MSTELRRHLRQICAAGPKGARPFDVEADGRRWTVGTDGAMLLAVDALFLPLGRGTLRAQAASLLTPRAPLYPFSLQRLKVWCGKPPRWCSGGDSPRLSFRHDGLLNAVAIDRSRLAKLLEPFREKEPVSISVRGHGEPIVVLGAMFRAVLMPLALGAQDGAPRLDLR
jgi:hypothetical protein